MATSVLVLQDSPDIFNPVPLALLAAGASVFVARDREDALEIVRTRRYGGFDAVVLDLPLPAAESARLRRDLGELGCDAPVLVIVGTDDSGVASDLDKPIEPSALVRRLKALIGRV